MAFTATPPPLHLSRHPLPQSARRPPPPLSQRSRMRAQLIGMPEGFNQNLSPNDSEVMLAELRFTEPDKLPALVQNSLPRLDEDFYAYLEQQINFSTCIQERETLRTLRDAITDIMKVMLDDAAADTSSGEGSEGTSAPTQKTNVTLGGNAVATASYDELIESLLRADDAQALKISVSAAYERVDMRLLERLAQRIASGPGDAMALTALRDAISSEMNARVRAATESLKGVLREGNAVSMRKAVNLLARQGKVDDAFVLLLQANLEQAQTAGATQAVEVLRMVRDHAATVKEMALEPEIKLLRALLRTEEREARVEMLMQGLKPRGSVTMMDGSATSGVQIDGKKFVMALRKLIEEFGNVDDKFVLKLSAIGEESEAVARKLFDMEDKDVRDLQDEAFHKRSVSIWDLERIEMEEKLQGREAAWEGRLGPIPEGFDEQGKMQV